MQLFFDELRRRGCFECFCVSIFLQHTLENTRQQTDVQRVHYLSASSVWQEQKTCWCLGSEMSFSSPRLQWLGELHFFYFFFYAVIEPCVTKSSLCHLYVWLKVSLSLAVQVQIAVLLFLLQHWPSLGHSLLNGTSGLSVFFPFSFFLLLTFLEHKAADFSHLQLHIKTTLYLLPLLLLLPLP